MFLNTTSIFFHKQTLFLFLLYFAARALSFVLVDHLILQSLLVAGLLFLLASAFFFSRPLAWTMLMGELFLGGNGQLFSLAGISIRSWFFIAFLVMWVLYAMQSQKTHPHFSLPKPLFLVISAVLAIAGVSGMIGIGQGHAMSQVIADAIPFAYFLLLFPAYYLLRERFHQEELIRLILVFIFGTAIWSLFIYFLFSSGTEVIHEPFYKWIRDSLGGKITDIGSNIFRVVFPAHLYVVPLSLLLLSLLMRNERHHVLWRAALLALLTTLALNMGRAYGLAIALGSLPLLIGHKPIEWLKEVAFAGAAGLGIFFLITTISSGSLMAGLGIAGLRVGSFVAPSSEVSTYTRTALLEPIQETIVASPLFGTGLGSTLTFYNPTTAQVEATTQYDWGWFELLAEQGMIGLVAMLTLIGMILYWLYRHRHHDYPDVTIGLFAGVIGMMIATVFGPVLTHVLGIVYLTLLLPLALHHHHIIRSLTPLLYQVFRPRIVDQ